MCWRLSCQILVHAYNSTSARHAAAREWWEKTLAGKRPVGMPWISVLGFIRIMTHRQILENPMRVPDCLRRVRAWLDHPQVEIIIPGEQHADVLFGFLNGLGTAGSLTTTRTSPPWPLNIKL